MAHISHNGFPVDMRVFEAFESKLQAQKDEYRNKLLDFGFPDPYAKTKDENGDYKRFVAEQVQRFIDATTQTVELVDGITTSRVTGPLNLCKGNMRMALVYMYNFANDPDFKHDFEDNVAFWLVQEKPKSLRKNEKAVYAEMVQEYELLKFFDAGKEIVMNALFGHIMEDLNKQREAGVEAYDLKHAVVYASDIIDANPHWLSDAKPVGPKTFLQEHIKDLLARNPNLELDKTEKSGDYKLTLKDMWRLEDVGVKDPFMETYTTFKHSEKYLSTYLNRENVKADGKIHAKFTNLMKTGRTSCTRPNLQNLPSRDKKYPLKNMFCAPEGAILCATDYSYVELVGFAQTCYSRFGFSVMRDVINAGLDPHRWFAGVMNKIIKPDLTNKDKPEWVEATKAFLKEHVPDAARQNAKASNFGFPGALGVKTFLRNCREQGIKMTVEEATAMRDVWISTFKEMQFHMNPLKAKSIKAAEMAYGLERHFDDAEEDDDDNGRCEYMAVLPCGQIRNRCSYNAACNTQFQGTVAVGAKVAGWNLIYNGYGDRLVNFVHDR